MRIAVYAGSFDPITRGHEDLIRRSLAFVDQIVVAVATNISKQPLFTLEERVAFVRAAVGGDPRVDVQQFNGLLVDFARTVGANLIIRGLRAVADFEYEFQMALMNRHLAPGLETVFMAANNQVSTAARPAGSVGIKASEACAIQSTMAPDSNISTSPSR